MTVDNPRVVLDILLEAPAQRVYCFRHARTGAVLYALFAYEQYDDIAGAPEVVNPGLLYDHGHWTEDGARWLTQERNAP
jgi:hypothetical protein